MQNFIKIFQIVQDIGSITLFQNLFLGKASTNAKCHLVYLGIELRVNINVYVKIYQGIPQGTTDRASFTFQDLDLGHASTIDLVNITLYAKFDKKISHAV